MDLVPLIVKMLEFEQDSCPPVELWRCGDYYISKGGKFYKGDSIGFRYVPFSEVPNYIVAAAVAYIIALGGGDVK